MNRKELVDSEEEDGVRRHEETYCNNLPVQATSRQLANVTGTSSSLFSAHVC